MSPPYQEEPLIMFDDKELTFDKLLVDLGAGGVVATLDNIMPYVEKAEQRLELAKERWPEKAEHLEGFGFSVCIPTDPLKATWSGEDIPDMLYFAHCDELLDRVAQGFDTREATSAEMLAVLMAASMIAPFNNRYAHAMGRLFVNVAGEEAALSLVPEYQKDAYMKQNIKSVFFVEEYKGAFEEAIDPIARRCYQKWRTPNNPRADHPKEEPPKATQKQLAFKFTLAPPD